MVEAVHDLPQIQSVTDVRQSSFCIAVSMLKQAQIEITKDSVGGVNSQGSLGDNDGFTCKLDGGVLFL